MLSYILAGVVLLIVAFVIVVAKQPSEFRLARSATMNAPAGAVFAQVNDFHNWRAWSPWERLDPELKRTYEGAPAGVGAAYSWVGNKKVGAGRMTITESRANELIRIKLEFFKPFKAINVTEFVFQPVAQQTSVTWSMTGTFNVISKIFCVFMNMDKMVGKNFEEGLANMKSVVEVVRELQSA